MDAVFIARNTVFAATAGAKTALNVIAGANQPVSLFRLCVSLDGATASAVPATVELCQSTQATTGTVGGSPPAIVQVGGRAITAQPTSQHNYTAEPTVLTPIEQWFVPQFNGLLLLDWPLGLEPDTDLSAGAVKSLAIRVNVTAPVNVLTYLRFGIGG